MIRGYVIEYNRIFFKNIVENESERVLPDLFSFFKKALHELSLYSLHLSFIIFQ